MIINDCSKYLYMSQLVETYSIEHNTANSIEYFTFSSKKAKPMLFAYQKIILVHNITGCTDRNHFGEKCNSNFPLQASPALACSGKFKFQNRAILELIFVIRVIFTLLGKSYTMLS